MNIIYINNFDSDKQSAFHIKELFLNKDEIVINTQPKLQTHTLLLLSYWAIYICVDFIVRFCSLYVVFMLLSFIKIDLRNKNQLLFIHRKIAELFYCSIDCNRNSCPIFKSKEKHLKTPFPQRRVTNLGESRFGHLCKN